MANSTIPSEGEPMKDTWAIRFSLTGPSAVNAFTVIDGATVKVYKNSQEMDVTNFVAHEQEHAIAAARLLGNIFLNKLSWKHNCHYEIAYPIRAARLLPSGQEDVRGIEPPIVYAASIEIKIMDSSGNVVGDSTELGKIEVGRSEAASYYRRAQLALDPFDKFRNFYSVVENVSSKIYKKQPGEPEKIELERALTICFSNGLESLEDAAKADPNFNSREDTIDEVVRILYRSNRCELDHSKGYKDKKVPFDPQDEKEVLDVLPLVKFVAKTLLEHEDTSL